MRLHELRPAEGSRGTRKRVGRGHGSGKGKTSGRGMNGQNSRSGGGVRPGFEGGQMPLQRRLPKRGFKSFTGTVYEIVNIGDLNIFDANTVITPELLMDSGLVKKVGQGIKVLGDGDLENPVTVQAHRFSAIAREKIENAGGKAEVI